MRLTSLQLHADRLQQILRGRGDYAYVHVRSRAGHLIVQTEEEGERQTIARVTPLGAEAYGLSFRTTSGRWEPMPVSGGLEEIATGVIDCLGPYLDRSNLR